jgi:uncharacterized delta-60 repeat protein
MKLSLLGVLLLPFLSVGCSSCSSSSNTPSPTFNLPPGPLTSDGMVMTDIGGGDDSANSIKVQEDGKIVVAGTTFNGTDNDITLLRYLENGQLDAGFGEDGIVIIDISNTDDHASHLFIQENGKMVVSGYTFNGTDNDFALLRFQENGETDLTFGTGGSVVTDLLGTEGKGGTVLQLENGNYLLGGMVKSESPCTQGVFTFDFVLLQYLVNGLLDTSFGSNGFVLTDFQCDQDYGEILAIQTDGKILLGGSIYISPAQDFSLARYLPDGTLDASFGTNGMVITELGDGYDFSKGILIQENPSGNIILSGAIFQENSGGFNFGILRYLSNGDVDISFGTGGIQTVDFSNGIDVADGILKLPNGNIILAGWAEIGSNRDYAVAMLFPNGSPNSNFGVGGKKTIDFGFGDDYGHAVCLGKDGRILVGGSSFNGLDMDIAIAQFDPSDN